jgi:hypothetical protein
MAYPSLIALTAASLLTTGKAPGSAKQVGQVFVFCAAAKEVGQEQKSLVLVLSCT